MHYVCIRICRIDLYTNNNNTQYAAVAHMPLTTKSSPVVLQAILESEPFEITLKDKDDALKLGKDFARELGSQKKNCLCMHKNTQFVWLCLPSDYSGTSLFKDIPE